MDFAITKLIWGLVKSPATWAYALFADQTGIKIYGQHSEVIQDGKETENDILMISDNGRHAGTLLFAITTDSSHVIDVLRIAVDYSTPLQLLDPVIFFTLNLSKLNGFHGTFNYLL